MNYLGILVSYFSNLYFLGFLSIVIAFMVSVRTYPAIIFLVHQKNLMDEPGNRSMHTDKTATLGGVGLFITFSLSIILFGIAVDLLRPDLIKLMSILASTIILLFLGIKDDLLVLSPKKKLGGQIISAVIVVFLTDVRINNLYGLFGIGELPYFISAFLTIFIFIFIINAYNLIDGIDGLAGAIAIISSMSFGIFFFMNANYLMVLVSCIMLGALLGFLKYNLSYKNKLFMGDSGSMFIGFLLAYQAIVFLGMNEISTFSFYRLTNAPIVALAVLSYPVMDTLRVFIVRLKQKRSPFSADRNHIHHRLLNLGLQHKQATLFIAVCNVLLIAITFLIGPLYIHVQLYIILILYPVLFLVPFLIVYEKGKLKLDIS
ncbi:MAG: MraY family glycosyltransferase [Saonia sp.]